jgi:aminoglycoside phosphotransferase (APT) family kinase protein
MDEQRRRWIEETLDGRVVGETRGLIGGSRELWYLDVEGRTGPVAAVLRVETGTGVFAGTDMSLAREAVVYRALQGTPVPIPALLGMSDDGSAILLDRLPGTSRTRGLPADQAASVLDSLMDAIGALHSLDVDALDLPGFVRPTEPGDHARVDLRRWRALAERHLPALDPMLAFAFEWLDRFAPTEVARTVLLQGDTGPGNFLAEHGAITGIVDWELSHLGDPMDDLAWIDMRITDSGLPTDPAQRDARYRVAGGAAIDERSLRYYAVFVQLRCALITAMTLARGGGALGYIAYRAPHHRFLVQLGRCLAIATDVALHPIDPIDGDPSVDTTLVDHAINGLTTGVIPSLSDREVKLRTRAALLTLEHRRARDRLADEVHRREGEDRRITFGREVDDRELVGLAAVAGTVDDPSVLDLLFRRAQRELALWATPAVGESLAPRPSSRDF